MVSVCFCLFSHSPSDITVPVTRPALSPTKHGSSHNYFREDGGAPYPVYDEGQEQPEEPVRGGALPPLADQYEEEEVVPKKQKKKRSKKSKKAKQQELVNEDQDSDYYSRKMNIPVATTEGPGLRGDSGSDNFDSGLNSNLTTTEL